MTQGKYNSDISQSSKSDTLEMQDSDMDPDDPPDQDRSHDFQFLKVGPAPPARVETATVKGLEICGPGGAMMRGDVVLHLREGVAAAWARRAEKGPPVTALLRSCWWFLRASGGRRRSSTRARWPGRPASGGAWPWRTTPCCPRPAAT